MKNVKVWFTSDTHFGHQRILELSRRPFSSVKEMDETIINNWNELVSETDIVYHLGDFGDYYKAKRLNGRIILLIGNYERDGVSRNQVVDLADKLEKIYNFYEVVIGETILKKFDGFEKEICLCHEPMRAVPGYFTLFGHIHQLQMVKKIGLNVGIDCHFFKPIDMNIIKFYKRAISEHYDENVFFQEW